MALLIQNTPILTGEDARRFRKNLFETVARKLSAEEKEAKQKEIEEMESSYNLLVSISNGAFY